ncbi:MAG: SBBP repeat-containing protein, partial [Bryobacteraceae bacterium]
MNRWVWLFFLSIPALARVDILSSKMPLVFERNEGQSAVEYKFAAVGPDHVLLLSPTGAVVRHAGAAVRIHWRGGKRRAAMAGLEPQAGRINYIVGNRRSGWRTGIRTYSKVRYQGIYPGVDLVFHGSRGELEFDFVVAPGADPDVIRLGFEGASRMEIDAAGDLVLTDANLRLRKPLIYQEGTPSRRTLEGGYFAISPREVGFRITSYDKSQPLVIDPVLSFSTYLGGTSSENVTASGDLKSAGIATDPQGNVYITGSTSSTDFPSGGKIGSAETGSADLFVSKFSSAGEMVYTTRIGGSSLERGFGIAVDSSGNAYLTGRTQSTDFPLVNAAQATFGGIEDAYVLKLNPVGNQLL